MGSVLRSLLGLGQFPPSLRCRGFVSVPRLRVQQCAVAFEPCCLFAGGRWSVVSRRGLAVVCRQAPDRWHGIYVGRAVPSLGAPTLTVPRCPPGAATRGTAPGYDHRALRLQLWIAAALLVASRFLGPAQNLNYAFADPIFHCAFRPAPVHLALIFAALAGIIYWPTHLLLARAFPPQ